MRKVTIMRAIMMKSCEGGCDSDKYNSASSDDSGKYIARAVRK